MEVALYHPQHGYYRRAHDPFGKQGDFYTAEQTPAGVRHPDGRAHRALYQEMGAPPDFTVVELGAGRREMAAAFSEWRYVPVDLSHSGEFARAFSRRGVCQRVLRCPAGGCGRFPRRRLPRDARRMGRPFRVGTAGSARARRRWRTICAATSRRPGRRALRGEPGCARLDGAHRACAGGGIRLHHRLRLHARRVRAFPARHADELPPAPRG
jgi:hypothetical protein